MKPTREQVIAWAREAGLYVDEDGEILEGDGWHTQTIFVQKAMTLAYEAGRKDENEAIEKEINKEDFMIKPAIEAAVLKEREAIAQSLDKQADLAADDIDRQWAMEMAAAVRARSNP